MKRLFVHIGRAKTGTTAIQEFLYKNREALRSRGVHYPKDDGPGGGHQGLAKSFIVDPPDFMDMPADPRAIQSALAEEINGSPTAVTLLSSENFESIDPRMLASFARDQLAAPVVEIVFFARSQDEFAESQYNQLVKWVGLQKTFGECVENNELGELDYAAVLQPWADVFGVEHIHARVFDAAATGRVIDDLLACLPLRPGAPFERSGPGVNESVGYLTLEVYRMLNGFEVKDRRKVYPALGNMLAPSDLPALLMDSAEARQLRHRFADSNRRFLQQYLQRDGDDLGGRRYSDEQRDAIQARIRTMRREGMLPGRR